MATNLGHKIQAVIFDMDGVLIDSEPFWREAMCLEFNAMGQPMTEAIARETMGVRVDEVVAHRYAVHPWVGRTQAEVVEGIIGRVVKLVNEKGKKLPGVDEAISLVRSRSLPLAIASSSPSALISAVADRLQLRSDFSVLYSAEAEAYGKPHPSVYLSTAAKLGISPERCLAIEDSVNGVIAAKAAKMKCIAIPELGLQNDARFGIADKKLRTLLDFNNALLSTWL